MPKGISGSIGGNSDKMLRDLLEEVKKDSSSVEKELTFTANYDLNEKGYNKTIKGLIRGLHALKSAIEIENDIDSVTENFIKMYSQLSEIQKKFGEEFIKTFKEDIIANFEKDFNDAIKRLGNPKKYKELIESASKENIKETKKVEERNIKEQRKEYNKQKQKLEEQQSNNIKDRVSKLSTQDNTRDMIKTWKQITQESKKLKEEIEAIPKPDLSVDPKVFDENYKLYEKYYERVKKLQDDVNAYNTANNTNKTSYNVDQAEKSMLTYIAHLTSTGMKEYGSISRRLPDYVYPSTLGVYKNSLSEFEDLRNYFQRYVEEYTKYYEEAQKELGDRLSRYNELKEVNKSGLKTNDYKKLIREAFNNGDNIKASLYYEQLKKNIPNAKFDLSKVDSELANNYDKYLDEGHSFISEMEMSKTYKWYQVINGVINELNQNLNSVEFSIKRINEKSGFFKSTIEEFNIDINDKNSIANGLEKIEEEINPILQKYKELYELSERDDITSEVRDKATEDLGDLFRSKEYKRADQLHEMTEVLQHILSGEEMPQEVGYMTLENYMSSLQTSTEQAKEYIKKSDEEIYASAMEMAKKRETVLKDIAQKELDIANKSTGEVRETYAKMAQETYKMFQEGVPDGSYRIDEKITDTDKLIRDLQKRIEDEKDPKILSSLNEQLDEAIIKLTTLETVYKKSFENSRVKGYDFNSDAIERYYRKNRTDYTIGKSHFNIAEKDKNYWDTLTKEIKTEKDLNNVIEKRKKNLVDLYKRRDEAEEKALKLNFDDKDYNQAQTAWDTISGEFYDAKLELKNLLLLQENWNKSAKEAASINVNYLDVEWREEEQVMNAIEEEIEQVIAAKEKLNEEDNNSSLHTKSLKEQIDFVKELQKVLKEYDELNDKQDEGIITEEESKRLDEVTKKYNELREVLKQYEDIRVRLKNGESYSITEASANPNDWNTRASSVKGVDFTFLVDDKTLQKKAAEIDFLTKRIEQLYHSRDDGMKNEDMRYNEMFDTEEVKRLIELLSELSDAELAVLNVSSQYDGGADEFRERIKYIVDRVKEEKKELNQLFGSGNDKDYDEASYRDAELSSFLNNILDQASEINRRYKSELIPTFEEFIKLVNTETDIPFMESWDTNHIMKYFRAIVEEGKSAQEVLEQLKDDVGWDESNPEANTSINSLKGKSFEELINIKDIEKGSDALNAALRESMEHLVEMYNAGDKESEEYYGTLYRIVQLQKEMWKLNNNGNGRIKSYDALDYNVRQGKLSDKNRAKMVLQDSIFADFTKFSGISSDITDQVSQIFSDLKNFEGTLVFNEGNLVPLKDFIGVLEELRKKAHQTSEEVPEAISSAKRAMDLMSEIDNWGHNNVNSQLSPPTVMYADTIEDLNKAIEKIKEYKSQLEDIQNTDDGTLSQSRKDEILNNINWLDTLIKSTEKQIEIKKKLDEQAKEESSTSTTDDSAQKTAEETAKAAEKTAEASEDEANKINEVGNAAESTSKKKKKLTKANQETAKAAENTSEKSEDEADGIDKVGDAAEEATEKIQGYIRSQKGDFNSDHYSYVEAIDKVTDKRVTHSVDEEGNSVDREEKLINYDKLAKEIVKTDTEILDLEYKISKASQAEQGPLNKNLDILKNRLKVYEELLGHMIEEPQYAVSDYQKETLDTQRKINKEFIKNNNLAKDAAITEKERTKAEKERQKYQEEQQRKFREDMLKREEADRKAEEKRQADIKKYAEAQQKADRKDLLKREAQDRKAEADRIAKEEKKRQEDSNKSYAENLRLRKELADVEQEIAMSQIEGTKQAKNMTDTYMKSLNARKGNLKKAINTNAQEHSKATNLYNEEYTKNNNKIIDDLKRQHELERKIAQERANKVQKANTEAEKEKSLLETYTKQKAAMKEANDLAKENLKLRNSDSEIDQSKLLENNERIRQLGQEIANNIEIRNSLDKEDTNLQQDLVEFQTKLNEEYKEALNNQNKIDATQHNKDAVKLYKELIGSAKEYYELSINKTGDDVSPYEIQKLDELIEKWEKAKEAKDEYALDTKGSDSSIKELKEVQDSFNNIGAEISDSIRTSLLKQMSKFTKYDVENKSLGEVAKRINNIRTELVDIKKNGLDLTNQADVERVKRIRDDLEYINSNKGLAEFKKASETRIKQLQLQIRQFQNNNTAMGAEFSKRFDELYTQFESAQSIAEVDKLKMAFSSLEAEVVKAGKTGNSFFVSFVKQLKSANAQLIATYFSLQDFIRYIREAAQTVEQIDSALTELRKVSDASSIRLQQNFNTSAETAKELGTTISHVINITSDWARLGYNVDQAEELARVTTLFKTVGDNMSADDASSFLVSSLQGFQMATDEAEHIIDVYNEVAKHYWPNYIVIYN